MDFTSNERDLLLAGLFELRINCLENDDTCGAIDRLAEKLHGGVGEMFYGHRLPSGAL
jgi:hypothetical protein